MHRKPLFEEVEQRTLYSADSLAGLADPVELVEKGFFEAETVESMIVDQDGRDTIVTTQTQSESPYKSTPHAGVDTADPTLTSYELVFVDTAVDDYDQLLQDLLDQGSDERQFKVYMLDGQRDGIEQITEILKDHSDLDAVHFVSHGTNGKVNLGNAWLDINNLDRYAADIGAWKDALGDGADLLIYGCDLASNAEGQTLVEALSDLTGADVAASTDDTGQTRLGGDWDLEYTVGTIQTNVAFSSQLQQTWQSLLYVLTVTTTADVVDGDADVNSLSALEANPGSDGFISLREAIIASDNDPGADQIFLNPGTYTLSLGSSGEDSAEEGDLDILDELTITGASAGTTIIDGNSNDRIFQIRDNGNLTMSEVTVQNGNPNSNGGGIEVRDAGQLTLTRVVITNNIGVRGAGIYNNNATMNLTDVVVSGNGDGTTTEGGGIHNKNAGTLNRVTISGNQAQDGGGIHNDNGGGTTLSLTNVTVSGNTASNNGGGLHAQQPVTIINSTFTLNHGNNVGGIHNNGTTIDIKNTIIGGNTANSSNVDVVGTFTSQGFNLIEDTTGGSGFIGSDITGASPMLDALADNGGFVQTHALQAGSLAIDAGTIAAEATVDGRNEVRDSAPDIGAFEVTTDISPTSEILVNTTTTDSRTTDWSSRGSHQTVAIAPDGNYVVVWSSANQDANGWEVYGQRFDKDGAKVGSEFRVNNTISNDQQYASVAIDKDGNFVVVWTSVGQDTAGTKGVFFRIFDWSLTPITPTDVQVNSTTAGDQSKPSVAMAANGNFAVAWEGNGSIDSDGIFVRRFSSTGAALDLSEISVNGNTGNAQANASVAMDAAGNFVVVWNDENGIWGQRFNDSSIEQGSDFQIDNSTNAARPVVAMDADGDFVVAWTDRPLGNDAIEAQRFDSLGASQGSIFIVNSTAPGDQSNVSVAMDAAGNITFVWEGAGTGDDSGVFARQYSASGSFLGSEFRVNQTQADTQHMASVAMLDPTNFVVAWTHDGPAVNDEDVFARQYGGNQTTSGTGSDGLWVSTSSDVNSPSGVPGPDSWSNGQVLRFGDPNLNLEPGLTDGVFSAVFNLDNLSNDGDADINALHYVSQNITVGSANSIALQAGDVLFSTTATESLISTNALTVEKDDLVLFRPDSAGDYSSGTFTMVLENLWGVSTVSDLQGVSLIEQSTTVGDTTLDAGDFLFGQWDFLGKQNDIFVFQTTDVGAGTTSGTDVKLIEGDDIGLGTSSSVYGLELIETGTTIGGQALTSGMLLVSTSGESGSVGTSSIGVTANDVFALTVTDTTLVAGTAVADAALLIEGNDVRLDTSEEGIDAIAMVGGNSAPQIDLDTSGAGLNFSTTFTEGAGAVNITDTDVSVVDVDGDSVTLKLVAGNIVDGANEVLVLGVTDFGLNADQTVNGFITLGGILIDVTYTLANTTMTITVAGGGSFTAAQAITALEDIAYRNDSAPPSTGTPRTFTISANDGTADSAVAVSTITVASANTAPQVDLDTSGAGLNFNTTFTEDAGAVNITDTDVSVVDGDGDNVTLTLVAANIADGGSEFLTFGITDFALNANQTSNGITVGGVSVNVGYVTGTQTFTVTNAAGNPLTAAEAIAVLEDIIYRNDSDTPSTGTARTFTITANDGTDPSVAAVSTVSVAAANDAPQVDLDASGAGLNFSTTFTEDAGSVNITDTDVSMVDPEGDSVTLILVAANIADGGSEVLTFGTTDFALNANQTSNGITVGGVSVNVGYVTGTQTFTVTNAAGNPLTAAEAIAVLEDITYRNDSDTPSTGTARTFTITANDSTDPSVAAVSTVSVAAANDAPQVDLDASGAGLNFNTTFTEDAGSVNITDTDVSMVDPEGDSVTLTLVAANIADGGSEVLTFGTTDFALNANQTSNGITVGGVSVNVGYVTGTQTFTVTNAAGNPLTAAEAIAVLEDITYRNDSHTPSTATARTFTITANDGTDPSVVAVSTITVAATNDAPQVDLDASGAGLNFSTTFTEGAGAVNITDTDVWVVDPESDAVTLTLVAANIADGANEVLTFGTTDFALNANQTSNGITVGGVSVNVGYVTGTQTFSITDAGGNPLTAAEVIAVLEDITYRNDSNPPSTATARTFTITANDGTDPSVVAVSTVAVADVNDEPTVTSTALNPTFTEDVSGAVALFSTTAINPVEGTQTITQVVLTVSNSETSDVLTIDGSTIGLSNGVTVTATNSYTVTVSGLPGLAMMTIATGGISGTASNSLVDGISYHSTSETPNTIARAVTLSSVTDSGSAGAPNDNTANPGIISTVTVVASNDAPVVSDRNFEIPGSATNDSLVGRVIGNDPDVGQSLSYTITAGNPAGVFAIDGLTGEITVNDAAQLDPASTAVYSLTIQVADNGVPILSDNATIIITATQAVQPPSIIDEPDSSEDFGLIVDAPGVENSPPESTEELTSSQEPDANEESQEAESDSPQQQFGGVAISGNDSISSQRNEQASGYSSISRQGNDGNSGDQRKKNNHQQVAQALNLGAKLFEQSGSAESSYIKLNFLTQSSEFRRGLDSLRESVHEGSYLEKTIIGSSVTITSGLSIGYVIWLIRGGVLLSSVLSSLPAWRMIDPLPVIAHLNNDSDTGSGDNDSLESLIRKGADAAKTKLDAQSGPSANAAVGDT